MCMHYALSIGVATVPCDQVVTRLLQGCQYSEHFNIHIVGQLDVCMTRKHNDKAVTRLSQGTIATPIDSA